MAWTDPRTWVAGETVTSSLMNTHLRDNLKAIGDAWTVYNPTWVASAANPAIGNGTLTGRYLQAGKLVIASIDLVTGSTTTYGSGIYAWSLPVDVLGSGSPRILGNAYITDASAGAFMRFAYTYTGSTVRVADLSVNNLNPTTPMTWTAGDKLSIQVVYEAA